MILNGRAINPGELRTPVVLRQRTVTVDAGGFSGVSYSDIATVWARWEDVHGSEVWEAEAIQAVSPATVLIRYYAGLDTTWAIKLGSIDYEIVSIDDIQQRHEYMELKVRRMRSG
jgi:SPP1 family predicted phage head-tail adaptor